MMFVLQVIFWVIFMYGLLSLSRDIFLEIKHQKINHNMKIVIIAKELERNLENFMLEISSIKRNNTYKKIIVIDLDESDDLAKINRRLSEEINVKILGKEDGRKYMVDCFENIGNNES